MIYLPHAIYSAINPVSLSAHIIIDLLAVLSAIIAMSLAAIRFIKKGTIWEAPTIWLTVTGISILIQLIFIDNNWLLRYTSYLVVMGLISITIGLYDYLPQNLSFNFTRGSWPRYLGLSLLILLLFSPFAVRTYDISIVPQSTNDIYEQQHQMALFLREYYQGDSVAANDIGNINYFADIKCLDLVGLSSNDVAQLREKNAFNARELDNLTNKHHLKIAIIYDQWYKGDIPSNWIKVGEWTTPHSVTLGNATVTFYATSPENAVELIQNLRSFSGKLPKDVKQSGMYTFE